MSPRVVTLGVCSYFVRLGYHEPKAPSRDVHNSRSELTISLFLANIPQLLP